VVQNVGRGIVAARNTAIERATAEVIVWLDADDRLLPGSLTAVLEVFDDPGVAVVAGSPRFVDETGRVVAHQPAPPDELTGRVVAMAFNPYSQSAVAFRRAPIIGIGGYRRGDDTDVAEDYDLWSRLLAAGAVFVGLPADTVTMVLRPSSETVRSAVPQSLRARDVRTELRDRCRSDLESVRRLRRLGRGLDFSWTTATPLDTYALGLFRLATQLLRQNDARVAWRVLAAAISIGPVRAGWSAARCAIGFRRRRAARGWTR
jgi:cellulose synthase/poly-beta-1,6-N-acetylglucosamine synthase-like glycosyltransferase